MLNDGAHVAYTSALAIGNELELELIQTHMAQSQCCGLKCARVALRASQNAKEGGLVGQAARVVQRVDHGVEQRQIAQLGTTANVALRKKNAAHHHGF